MAIKKSEKLKKPRRRWLWFLTSWVRAFLLFIPVLSLAGMLTVMLVGRSPDSGEIILVLALVNTLIASFATVANWASVLETRTERIKRERPEVLGFFEFTTGGILVFVLHNIGNGPAEELSVKFDPEFVTARGQVASEVSLFVSPIAFFPPGRRHRQVINTVQQYLQTDHPKQITASVEYKNMNGKSYKRDFYEDLSTWGDISMIQYDLEYYASQIVKELDLSRGPKLGKSGRLE